MAHINYFGVENFKVFGKFTEFNFRPITILTGANGSGKSALTKAMQLAGQAFGGYSLSQELDFSRNPLLGNYQTTISGKDVDRSMTFAVKMRYPSLETNVTLYVTYETAGDRLKNGKLVKATSYFDDGVVFWEASSRGIFEPWELKNRFRCALATAL